MQVMKSSLGLLCLQAVAQESLLGSHGKRHCDVCYRYTKQRVPAKQVSGDFVTSGQHLGNNAPRFPLSLILCVAAAAQPEESGYDSTMRSAVQSCNEATAVY